MKTRTWVKGIRLGAWVLALSSTAFLAGCGDALTVTAQAHPPSIVLGEGSVALKGAVGPNAAFADHEWRMIKRPAGSDAAVGDATSADASFAPDVAGEYEFQFTATVGNTRSGGGLASAIGGRTAISARVTVTALPRPAGNLVFVVQPTESVAGASFQPPVSVELRDDGGAKITDAIGITLTVAGGDASARFVGTPTATTIDGVATFSELGIDVAGGGYTLKASAAGITSATSLAFDVVAGPPDAAQSTFVATPAKVSANGVDTIDLQLNVRDAFGNAVSDVAVAFASAGDLISPSSAGKTDEAGVFSAKLASTRAGFRTVKASFRGEQLSVDVRFEAGAADEQRSRIQVTPPEAAADGQSTVEIAVSARDAFDNPIVGEPVALNVSGTGNTLSPTGTPSTDESGVCVFTLNSTVAETKILTASLAGFTLDAQANFTSLVVDETKSTMTVVSNGATADGASEIKVSVKLVDARLNPMKGVSVHLSSDAARDVFSPAGAVETDDAGVASVTVKSTLAGTRPVRAVFGELQLEGLLVFVAGAPSEDKSTLTTSPGKKVPVSDKPNLAMTVRVVDAFDNPVNGAGVHFVEADAQRTTDADGLAKLELNSTIAGFQTVTAKIGDFSKDETVEFEPGPAVKGTLTVDFSQRVADDSSSSKLSMRLDDEFGNVVPDAVVTFSAPGTGHTITNGDTRTDSDGVATASIRSKKAESKVVSARSGSGIDEKVTVSFVSGAPDNGQSSFIATPESVIANGTAPSKLLLVVKDRFGNPVSGETVALRDDRGKVDYSTESLVTNTQGAATVTVSSSTGGVANINATSERGLDQTVAVTFVQPPRVFDLTVGMEGVCAEATFDLEGNESGRVAVRYEYEGPDGALRTATPYERGEGSLPQRRAFHWDMAKDLRGLNMTSVTFVVTPSLDGVDGISDSIVMTGLSFPLFGATTTLDGIPRISGLSTADVDSDGRPDLVASVREPSAFVVFHGQEGGRWVKDERTFEITGDVLRHQRVDLTNNGEADTLIAYAGSEDGFGSFEIRTRDIEGSPLIHTYPDITVVDFVVTDVDGDGRLDIVVVGRTREGYVVATAQQTRAGFSERLIPVGDPTTSVLTGVAVGDVNGDGASEIVVTDQSGAIRVATAMGRGAESRFVIYPGASQDAHSPVLVDNSGKGWANVFVASQKDQSIVVFENDVAAEGFNAKALRVELHARAATLTGGDFSHNGHRDVLVTLEDGTVHLLVNDGVAMGFVESVATVGQGPVSVVAADFNKDGLLDFATANAGSQSISVVYNSTYAECR